ncbi:hypothetical protein MUO14_08840 [Halobacillus shinanisalinarum]|uniref:YkzH n=1 Tax=Halobacillus shinanisalinarum TaxID=2932258 RepID=A0ABY4H4B9_9BACI|nr:hypothetical protein [Halobacillus shinanisalinarum]UOQ95013.1 hypothetical protein MUO14_08840 [Halobacillus shinanisalinarum]
MSSHNSYQPDWHPYLQNQSEKSERSGYRGHVKDDLKGSEERAHSQGVMHKNGIFPEYPPPSQRPLQQQRDVHGYPYSSFPSNSYHGNPADMQYMMQVVHRLEIQMDKLSQLIAQNNQLLQSMHDQEDTKCVQGNGGGAVIVRM